MKTIGFVISNKKNEKRRAIIPEDLKRLKYPSQVYIENGYGDILGFEDEDYRKYGCNIVNKEYILNKCDVICDPKIGEAEYLNNLNKGVIIWGWIHAVQNKKLTDLLLEKNLTVYAWEDMFNNNQHVFWKNNELAGEAAVIHAFQCYGKLPKDSKIAILGNGNTGRGAYRRLTSDGADVTVYNRKTEAKFKEELHKYDVVVNAVLWDLNREDHILSKSDLKRMKKNSMIIDISCDEGKGIESSYATSVDNPTYKNEGVLHYCVDHTPSIYYKTASKDISNEIVNYMDYFINETKNIVLENSIIIKDNTIIDDKIKDYQNR